MKLLFDLDKKTTALLRPLVGEEKIIYAIPCDLDKEMYFTDGMLIVTDKHCVLVDKGEIADSVNISDITSVTHEVMTSGSLMRINSGNESRVFAVATMRYTSRLHYIANGIQRLIDGNPKPVATDERDNLCQKCGRSISGTSCCPHCMNKFSAVTRLAGIVKPYWKTGLIILAMFVTISLAAAIEPTFYSKLVDDVLSKSDQNLLLPLIIAILLTQVIKQAATIIRGRSGARMSSAVAYDLRKLLFNKVEMLSMGNIASRKPGELFNRINRDTEVISNFLYNRLFGTANDLFTIIVIGVFMFLTDWRLAILALVPIPIVMLMHIKFHEWTRRMFRKQHRLWDSVNTLLNDIFNGIRVIKSFGKEKRAIGQFGAESRKLADRIKYNEVRWGTLYPILAFLMTSGQYLIIYFSGDMILNEAITLGTFMQFMSYISMIYWPLGNIAMLPRDIAHMLTSVERIYDILEESPTIDADKPGLIQPIKGNVEFRNVDFGYRSYEPVLHNVSLDVKAGEMIGLVGHSGSGKSTFINLVMRLYDPDEGEILIDGINVKEYDHIATNSQIGVVLQETFLFSGTIAENIRYAKPDATYEEIIQAAKIANAHDFIVKFADGYDTYVGEHGYNLSGGERQRIAIARAILHDPRILILDEATSSLDTDTEQSIQEALARLVKNRTTFAIAHRLSTLKNADRLVVLEKGRIAEIGTHEELIKLKGIYFNLVMSQRQLTRTAAANINEQNKSA